MARIPHGDTSDGAEYSAAAVHRDAPRRSAALGRWIVLLTIIVGGVLTFTISHAIHGVAQGAAGVESTTIAGESATHADEAIAGTLDHRDLADGETG